MVYDRYWSMYQWWTSVSIGILLLAHFAADRLNAISLIFLVILYAVYSVWVHSMVWYNVLIANGYLSELRNLVESGQSNVIVETYLDDSGNIPVFYGYVAASLLYVGTNAYLIYRFVKTREEAT